MRSLKLIWWDERWRWYEWPYWLALLVIECTAGAVQWWAFTKIYQNHHKLEDARYQALRRSDEKLLDAILEQEPKFPHEDGF